MICLWQVVKLECTIYYRFLADVMDNPDLLRNVALCGQLHHGKVGCGRPCTWVHESVMTRHAPRVPK
jgi:U5 small nuclear ribonucleoprotein component